MEIKGLGWRQNLVEGNNGRKKWGIYHTLNNKDYIHTYIHTWNSFTRKILSLIEIDR